MMTLLRAWCGVREHVTELPGPAAHHRPNNKPGETRSPETAERIRQQSTMSLPPRPFSSHLRGSSVSGAAPGPSPALLARIEEKKAELDNLKQLRDLSADVATQMEVLEQKLSTLSDGTEGLFDSC